MLIQAPMYAPPCVPTKRRATDAEVLRHAAEIIDRDGWSDRAWVDDQGRVCILGAIGRSAIELERWKPIEGEHPALAVRYASHAVVSVALVRDQLVRWNDQWCASATQVKDKLLSMASKREME